MRYRGVVIPVLLTFALLSPPLQAGTSLETTKTSKEELQIKQEVVAFYKGLIKDNPEVRAAHEKLVQVVAGEGRPPAASEEVTPVLWEEDYELRTGDAEDPRTRTEVTATYLTFQNINEPARRSFSAKHRVVAEFKVIYERVELPNPKEEGKRLLERNTLTIKFEGFRDVTVRSIK